MTKAGARQVMKAHHRAGWVFPMEDPSWALANAAFLYALGPRLRSKRRRKSQQAQPLPSAETRTWEILPLGRVGRQKVLPDIGASRLDVDAGDASRLAAGAGSGERGTARAPAEIIRTNP